MAKARHWNITNPWSFVPSKITQRLVARAIREKVGPKATAAEARGMRTAIINESISIALARLKGKRDQTI